MALILITTPWCWCGAGARPRPVRPAEPVPQNSIDAIPTPNTDDGSGFPDLQTPFRDPAPTGIPDPEGPNDV